MYAMEEETTLVGWSGNLYEYYQALAKKVGAFIMG